MYDGKAGADLEVWCASAPAVHEDPNLMFALCSVQLGSTATKLVLKQKEPPCDKVGFLACP